MATKTFNYEAIDPTGALVKGKIEAESPDAAAKSLSPPAADPARRRGRGHRAAEGA